MLPPSRPRRAFPGRPLCSFALFAERKGQCAHPGSKIYNSKAEVAGAGVGGVRCPGTNAVSIAVGIVT